jgi:hypothetical protein
MQPRIYTYKVTFEEIPHWYWGVHKEKKYGELYLGSPVTNRWMWEFYTPHVQILEVFPCTDEGWTEARLVEIRVIRPDLDNPLCLNERCGGTVSMNVARKSGLNAVKNQTGIHAPGFYESERFLNGRINSINEMRSEKRGLFKEGYLGSEGQIEAARRGGLKAFQESKGIFEGYIGSEEHIEKCKTNGKSCVENEIGWFSKEAKAKRSQPVLVTYPDGAEITYPTINEAQAATGLGKNTITRIANGTVTRSTYKTKGMVIKFLPRFEG